ncbi:MAG: hypothetical protein LBF38_11980 [Deltaproteobacteria bacterium]|jgi:hypothetical protein|nr:hypothetical protein [Deltaproteobacteria bacterium]
MFFRESKKRKLLNQRAIEVEKRANANPYKPVEVDIELAEHMGAFEERALGSDDFYELESGFFDWDSWEDGSKDEGR